MATRRHVHAACGRSPTGRRLRAWAALGCALSLALAYLAQLGHYVLIAHQRCADHGELVHVVARHAADRPHHGDDAHAGAHAPAGDPHATKAPDARPAGPAVEADAEHDDHDHCPASAHRSDATVVPASPVVARQSADASSLAAPTGTSEVGRDLLALAPKASPPASLAV